MEELFIKLLNMSITASWLILAVILCRLLFKKAPKWMNYLLWGMVAVRLICPVSVESALSLIPSTETVVRDIQHEGVPVIDSGSHVIDNVINNPVLSTIEKSETAEESAVLQEVEGEMVQEADGVKTSQNEMLQKDFFKIVTIVWIAGIAVMFVYCFISYIRLWRKTREAVRLRENIWQCDNIGTAFIMGIFRPQIYIPSSLDGEQMDCVLSHEKSHIKCFDHLWKPIGFAILTIYWFHPLVWVAYILLCKDIEIACDARVVKKMNLEQKKAYSKALLECSVSRYMISACPVAFGEVGVKTRVKSVLHYQKPAVWISVIAIFVCGLSVAGFLTNPKETYSPPRTYGNYLWVSSYYPDYAPSVSLRLDGSGWISRDTNIEIGRSTYTVENNELFICNNDGRQIVFYMEGDTLRLDRTRSSQSYMEEYWGSSEEKIADGAIFISEEYALANHRSREPLARLLDNEGQKLLYKAQYMSNVIVRYYDKDGNYIERVGSTLNPCGPVVDEKDYVLKTYMFCFDEEYFGRDEDSKRYVSSANIRMYYAYEWLVPSNKIAYADEVMINWSDDRFVLVEDSFKKIDKYTIDGVEFVTEYNTEYTKTSDGGIKWNINLNPDTEAVPDRLYGSGSFEIVTKECLGKIGKNTFCSKYTHGTDWKTSIVNESQFDYKWLAHDVQLEDYDYLLSGEYVYSNEEENSDTSRINFYGWSYQLRKSELSGHIEWGAYEADGNIITLLSDDGLYYYVFEVTEDGLVYDASKSHALHEDSKQGEFTTPLPDGAVFKKVE